MNYFYFIKHHYIIFNKLCFSGYLRATEETTAAATTPGDSQVFAPSNAKKQAKVSDQTQQASNKYAKLSEHFIQCLRSS